MIVGIVLPSRLESTRLSQKALRPIAGVPLVVRAWQQAIQVRNANWVLVATDSPLIAAVVSNVGGKSMITASTIQSGTERLAAVDDLLDQKSGCVCELSRRRAFSNPRMLRRAIHS